MKKNKPVFDLSRKENIVEALSYLGQRQKDLFRYARQVRDKVFAGAVEARSVIEYSNVCRQECGFCGMNRFSPVERYCMKTEEFLGRFERLYAKGRRVIMVQSGEFGPGPLFEAVILRAETSPEQVSGLLDHLQPG